MSDSEYRSRSRNGGCQSDGSYSDSNVSFVTDPEPENSFTHYLFLKTDFSLSRLSRKLIMQLNNINLNDDDDNDNEEIHFGKQNKSTFHSRRRSADSVGGREEQQWERKRSLSLDNLARSDAHSSVHRLNQRPSCKRKEVAARNKSFRNKHGYNDWLDDHKDPKSHKEHHGSKMTKIIRIDINEIDQIETSDLKNINYLDDMFQENNVNKFYSFGPSKLTSKSFYLATNAALSCSSLNSEMSEKTFAKASVKRDKRNKKKTKRARKPKEVEHSHRHEERAHGHHRHEEHHSHGHNHHTPTEEIKQKKKKHGLLRTATMNMISRAKKGKAKKQVEYDSDFEFETEYSGDLRTYAMKKHEINDNELNVFMASGRCCKRRDAIVHKIDTLYKDGELHTFMENLLRQEYIESFLL